MSVSTLSRILPNAPTAWLVELVRQMPTWGIDTPHEIASFIAQLAHESAEFTRLEEDLNYSASRLMVVWPKRFPTLELAVQYAHSPAKLANYVYANRLGNGDEASGDGWAFRGMGPPQLTGRANYAACQKGTCINVVDFPEMLLTPKAGVTAACWFWKSKGFDAIDDDADILPDTRRFNGGEHGLKQRQAYFQKALVALTEVA